MMDINWKAPFELAFELGMYVLGSALLLIVAFVGLALLVAFGQAFLNLFRSGKNKKSTKDIFKVVK
jgi:hypothetical protein